MSKVLTRIFAHLLMLLLEQPPQKSFGAELSFVANILYNSTFRKSTQVAVGAFISNELIITASPWIHDIETLYIRGHGYVLEEYRYPCRDYMLQPYNLIIYRIQTNQSRKVIPLQLNTQPYSYWNATMIRLHTHGGNFLHLPIKVDLHSVNFFYNPDEGVYTTNRSFTASSENKNDKCCVEVGAPLVIKLDCEPVQLIGVAVGNVNMFEIILEGLKQDCVPKKEMETKFANIDHYTEWINNVIAITSVNEGSHPNDVALPCRQVKSNGKRLYSNILLVFILVAYVF